VETIGAFSDPVRARHFDLAGRLAQDARLGTQIELENAGNHDDGLGPMSILEHREPERFRPIDEQAAAKVLLVLNNPVTAAVLTDEEELRSRRGRFQLPMTRLLVGLEHRRLPGQQRDCVND